jgi:serine phosphatase RsbU (regulator of sigma subunit)
MATPAGRGTDAGDTAPLGGALASLLSGTTELPASELARVVDVAGRVLGASSARMLVADYGLLSLQELGGDGPRGPRRLIEGTLAGRCFASGEIVVAGHEPAMVFVPLAEGSERLGVLELTLPAWSEDLRSVVGPVVRVLVLVLISKRRYTDVVLRARRAQPLSVAAEIQWTLLPPLTYSSSHVSVSGILEPAYSIGGDSFDYALNPDRAEFAIVDAVGHGISAVSISVLALNSLRNARREGYGLEAAYLDAGRVIEAEFGRSAFATGQIGQLALDTGELTWLNAGHPLPLLVRDHTFVRQLACPPSIPMGLGGAVKAIATDSLQPGDRVLFYTDGVVESTSPDGETFGVDRLADLLVRTAADGISPAETVRRLAAAVLAYNRRPLRDDATLLLLEYHGSRASGCDG